MKLERFTRNAAKARADLATLEHIKSTLHGAMAQGLIEFHRVAQQFEYLDPDEVMAAHKGYFGPDGTWKDLLTDALWESKIKCAEGGDVGLSFPNETAP